MRPISATTGWQSEIERCQCNFVSDRQELWRRAQKASNLSPEMRQLSFQNFKRVREQEAFDVLKRFAEEPSGWVVLTGAPGTGKTHLLAATTNRLLATDNRPMYTIVPELLRYLRSLIGTDSMESRFEQIRDMDVLLLDDLGAEYETDWALERLYLIFDHRYRHQMPTVIATNLAVENLTMRIASRAQDRALSRVIVMASEDDYRIVRTPSTPPDKLDAALAQTRRAEQR